MYKPVVRIACVVWWLFVAVPAYSAGPPLTFGIFPYVSPGKLVAHQHGLEQYLASQLNRPVIMVTAPGYHSFFERTHRGDYDLVLTAPNFARLAEVRDGYRPLAITEHHIGGVFLVRRDGPIRHLKDLAGRTVTETVPEAMVSQLAQRTLREHGLVPGHDVTIVVTKTFNNAIFAALRGDSAAGVTGFKLWEHLAPRYKTQLRAIAETASAPGFVLLANPKLDAKTIAAAQAAALDFAHSPAGKHYLFIGFKPVTEEIMESFDQYTKVLKAWE